MKQLTIDFHGADPTVFSVADRGDSNSESWQW
jgi:hypothetical protein